MKLLRKHEGGTLEVLQSEARLAGHLDAFSEAQKHGDGEYIADFGDGSYLPFKIKEGAPMGGVSIDDIQYGQPYRATEEGARFHDKQNDAVHGYVPDVVGREEDTSSNAWEDYVPKNAVRL